MRERRERRKYDREFKEGAVRPLHPYETHLKFHRNPSIRRGIQGSRRRLHLLQSGPDPGKDKLKYTTNGNMKMH